MYDHLVVYIPILLSRPMINANIWNYRLSGAPRGVNLQKICGLTEAHSHLVFTPSHLSTTAGDADVAMKI